MFHNRVEIHNNFYGPRLNSPCCRPINPFCCGSFNVFDFYRFNNNYGYDSLGLNPFTINPLGINPFSLNSFAFNFNNFNPYSIISYNNPVFNYGNQFGMFNTFGSRFNTNPFSSLPMNFPSFNFNFNPSTTFSHLQENTFSEAETNSGKKVKHKLPTNAKKLGKPFLDKVKQVARNLNCDYSDLLAIINSESGFNTQAGYNPKTGKIGCAVGLIQFTQPAIDDLNRVHRLNLTKEKILNMSALEQLDLAEKYLKIAKGYAGFSDNHKMSSGELYAITFLPGRANREVLCQKGEGNPFYEQNEGLDKNKDNKITRNELAQRVDLKRVDDSQFAAVA